MMRAPSDGRHVAFWHFGVERASDGSRFIPGIAEAQRNAEGDGGRSHRAMGFRGEALISGRRRRHVLEPEEIHDALELRSRPPCHLGAKVGHERSQLSVRSSPKERSDRPSSAAASELLRKEPRTRKRQPRPSSSRAASRPRAGSRRWARDRRPPARSARGSRSRFHRMRRAREATKWLRREGARWAHSSKVYRRCSLKRHAVSARLKRAMSPQTAMFATHQRESATPPNGPAASCKRTTLPR